jgi:outer membrane protein, heavy metal efflux system
MFSTIRKYILCIIALLICSANGFSFQPPDMPEQPKTPLGSQYEMFQADDLASGDEDADRVYKNPTGVLTLDQALALGLLQNPELASFSWEVRASQSRLVQEGLWPNPEIETSVENFGGDNGLEGFDGAETTVQINQMIELGGKRTKRMQVATLEKDIAGWDYESKRLDVFADITKSFWDAMAAQENSVIAGEIATVAEDAYRLAAERVKAGKVPPIEEIQSKVTVSTTHIELEQSKRALETARKKLAATWGSAQPVFEKVTADMNALAPPPSLDTLKKGLTQNPDLARWDAEIEKSRAQVNLADADRIPDLTVGAGPRYYNEIDETAFVMNISVPIPIFNRNQGGIQEARFNLAKARENRKASMLKAENDLEQAYQALASSYLTADSLMKMAIPAAEIAFSASMEGYREGKINYLAVLEARRTFFEVKRQYIAVIVEYYNSKVDIERLIGCDISQSLSFIKENI